MLVLVLMLASKPFSRSNKACYAHALVLVSPVKTRFYEVCSHRVGAGKNSYLVFRGSDWLRETKERQSKIDESVLEGLQFLISLNDLKFPQKKSMLALKF